MQSESGPRRGRARGRDFDPQYFQRYGDADAHDSVLALDDISLDIGRGEFVCLLGPSGCGKSTLLNIVGGLFKPSSGSVTVGGRPVNGTPLPARDRLRLPGKHAVSLVYDASRIFVWR